MIRCVALAAAVATILAAPATAQATGASQVGIVVQSTAQLTVIDSSSSTAVTNNTVTTAGSTALTGSTAGMGHLRLVTDTCIGGIEFDFPRVTGLRGNPSAFYGKAVGQGSGNTLGVQPFVQLPTGSLSFGILSGMNGQDADAPLSASGATYGLCSGAYDIFVGLATRWDLTLPGEPMFAAPDTYRIPVTATIVSSP